MSCSKEPTAISERPWLVSLNPDHRISSRSSASTGMELVLEVYDAAVAAAAPGELTARAIDALSIARESRVWVFGFGKAAHTMAAAAVSSLLRSLHSIVGGVVVSADAGPSPY